MRKDAILAKCISDQAKTAAELTAANIDPLAREAVALAHRLAMDAAFIYRVLKLEDRVTALEAASNVPPHVKNVERRNEAFYGIEVK